jgi:NTE family protein
MQYSRSIYLLTVSAILFISGCSAIGKIENNAVTHIPETSRYSYLSHIEKHQVGDTLFLLAFSGGGTRAAALSYGVLEELRDTTFQKNGQNIRLLDEVDKISSVSGGSFTSAYYGLNGDKIFDNYKNDFLYRDVQGELEGRVLGFFNILSSFFTTRSRTEKAINYYDKYIFKGKTFADLDQSGPFILINATDLNAQSQFIFVQHQFDFLCSDLSEFKIARAVAASSAVPLVFPPILIEKHSECHYQEPKWLIDAGITAKKLDDKRLQDTVNSLDFYLDKNKPPPYVTLVDGGVTDNLGLRTILRIDSVSNQIQKEHFFKGGKRLVVIVVDASTKSKNSIGMSTKLPSMGEVIGAVTDVQLHLYNIETNTLLKDELRLLAKEMSTTANPVESYFIDLHSSSIKDKDIQENFNNIPTSFSLKKEEVDMLIDTARNLLQENPEYIKLLKDIGATTTN